MIKFHGLGLCALCIVKFQGFMCVAHDKVKGFYVCIVHDKVMGFYMYVVHDKVKGLYVCCA